MRQAGHVLGFHHPDTAPDDNIESLCAVNNATCHDPWGCAALRHYDTEQKSIMHSLTMHEPRTCLAESDLAGLHHLYPTCDGLLPADVTCHKTTRLSGWLRLASVAGIPFLIATIVILVPLHFVRRHQQQKIQKLGEEARARDDDPQ
jgi:hypothetical protein